MSTSLQKILLDSSVQAKDARREIKIAAPQFQFVMNVSRYVLPIWAGLGLFAELYGNPIMKGSYIVLSGAGGIAANELYWVTANMYQMIQCPYLAEGSASEFKNQLLEESLTGRFMHYRSH